MAGKMGFEDVAATGVKNDALNTIICNKKPRLVIIDSWFYRASIYLYISSLLGEELCYTPILAFFQNHTFIICCSLFRKGFTWSYSF